MIVNSFEYLLLISLIYTEMAKTRVKWWTSSSEFKSVEFKEKTKNTHNYINDFIYLEDLKYT